MKETFYNIAMNINLTVAVLSDLHNRKGTEALRSMRKQRPDIITIVGDIVTGLRSVLEGLSGDELLIEQQKNIIPFLKSCVEIAPTFISMGNHEWFISEEDMSVIASIGVHVLDNRWVEHSVRGQMIYVGGLTSVCLDNYRKFRKSMNVRYPIPPKGEKPKIKNPDSRWINEFEKCDGYKILLSHHPEYWSLREPKLCGRKINLVLSGHAHGGQIRLWSRGVYAPGQGLFPRYTKGVWMRKYGYLVVSTGLSNTSSVLPRFFNPTEVVYVKISKTDDFEERVTSGDINPV